MSTSFSFLGSRSVLGLVLLVTTTGVAAPLVTPAGPLSLGQALALATEHNPALLAQGYSERAATALVEQAGLRPNPTVDVTLENFAGSGRVRGVNGLETTVQASQTLERGGKRGKRVALAEREREAAGNEFAAHRLEVRAASATAYVGMLAAQQRLALATEPLQLARETVAAVEVRVKAAVASPAESARARAALSAAQADYARAEASLAAARAALVAMWGGQLADVSRVTGTLQVPAELPKVDAFLAKLVVHPRLSLQQSVVAGRRAALELAQAHAVPDITFGGGMRFLREGTDAAFLAGVSVPLPFRNKNQGNIRAAREVLAGAEQGVRAVEVGLHATFTAVWQDLTASHSAALNLRREALPATAEAYATVRHAYEQGQLPLIDVLDAQRALITLRRELLDAEAAYATALARVEALTDASYATLTTLIDRS